MTDEVITTPIDWTMRPSNGSRKKLRSLLTRIKTDVLSCTRMSRIPSVPFSEIPLYRCSLFSLSSTLVDLLFSPLSD